VKRRISAEEERHAYQEANEITPVSKGWGGDEAAGTMVYARESGIL